MTNEETTLTVEEAKEALLDYIEGVDVDSLETDHEGQLIIYTGVYRWEDGSYHNKSEND